MDISPQDRSTVYSHWLRTGRWPVTRTQDGVELKFNPYHDPSNGQFTFAPGGSATGQAYKVRQAQMTSGADADRASRYKPFIQGGAASAPLEANLTRPPTRMGSTAGRGNNSRAFEDPMTLEQVVPSLRDSPAGAIFALADNVFDLTGPGTDTAITLLRDRSTQLIGEIKAIDPKWHYDALGPVDTVQGNINRVNELRFYRAVVMLHVRGDVSALQVETLRFVQERTDQAYDRGTALLKTGKLNIRLSPEEAIGNYIDREVRGELRERYGQFSIDSAGKGPVRVNRREDDSSGTELTYRRPDARVGNVAFDVTLTRKTLQTPQVRGFFNTDFRPNRVVIIRPRQLGAESSYVISRPETK